MLFWKLILFSLTIDGTSQCIFEDKIDRMKYSIAIHGGAGTLVKGMMTPEKEKAYKAALSEALNSGYSVLENGGSAMDAVEAAVVSLENCRKSGITQDELLQAIREHGSQSVEEVDSLILEADGNISVVSNDYKHHSVRRLKKRKNA